MEGLYNVAIFFILELKKMERFCVLILPIIPDETFLSDFICLIFYKFTLIISS